MEIDTTIQDQIPDNPIKQKGLFPIVGGMIILLVVVAGGAYYLGTKSVTPRSSTIPQVTPTPIEENIPTIPPTATPTPTIKPVDFPVPRDWKKTSMINNTLTLCLPPKWEADQWNSIYFNRDPAYRPTVAYIAEIPYTSGSRREAYYKYWESEYPNVRDLASIKETSIGNNSVLTIFPADISKDKYPPDGNLAVIWLANGKLWKAGLSNWSMVNDSQSAFLKDFYTAISCSFTN